MEDKELNIDYYAWFRHSGQSILHDDSWRSSQTTPYTLLDIEEAIGGYELTHLKIDGKIPNLLDYTSSITSIMLSNAPMSGVYNLDPLLIFQKFQRLEEVYLSYNDFSKIGIPNMFTNLKHLRILEMNGCGLKHLSRRLSRITTLEHLDLAYNNFSSGLPDIFSSLTKLKTLNLEDCNIVRLPPSLCWLKDLIHLNISQNDFADCDDVCDMLTKFPLLQKLAVSRLHNLNPSLSILGKSLLCLHLYDCNFSKGLPNIITTLTKLTELKMSSCRLIDLPNTMKSLQSLKNLMLQENEFTKIPASLALLKSLELLELTNNKRLKTLDRITFTGLENLQIIQLEKCELLEFPPYGVCQQGVQAIKQYYQDYLVGAAKSLPLATVAVIGQKLAGKTSLIWTLRDKQRRLTERSENPSLDLHATKVFDVQRVSIGNEAILRIIDTGGHEVYHLTYQLTLRQNCVPVIVVNMEEFSRKIYVDQISDKEAVRTLCLDWISHLYLASPTLGPPKLVLTHKDKFENEEFYQLKQKFLETLNSLRTDIVEEEERLQSYAISTIQHLSQKDKPIFDPTDIFEVGKDDDYSVYEALEMSLYEVCKNYIRMIPQKWDIIDKYLEQLDKPVTTFEALFSELSSIHSVERQQLETILMYMHDAGRLFYFNTQNSKLRDLDQYIFHKVPEVTKLLSVIFYHDEKAKWSARRREFKSFKTESKDVVDDEVYVNLVEKFRQTGAMVHSLLCYFIRRETSFQDNSDVKAAISLLKAFQILYGPVKHRQENSFIIPYHAVGYEDDVLNSKDGIVKFRVEITYKGLALPHYAYQQMTIGLLELFPDVRHFPIIKYNGGTVRHGTSQIRLLHDYQSRKAVVLLSCTVENIARSWTQLIDVTNNTIKHTLDHWSGSRPTCTVFCSHCLMKGETLPKKSLNPPWCHLSPNQNQREGVFSYYYSGIEPVICGEDLPPSPLVLPCNTLSKRHMKVLARYVANQRKQVANDFQEAHINSTSPKMQYSHPGSLHEGEGEDAESELSDDGDDNWLPCDHKNKELIQIEVKKTTKRKIKALFKNQKRAFMMSRPCSGRALIINNKEFKTPDLRNRNGSEHDLENLCLLFRDLGFEVDHHSNLNIQKISLAIRHETAQSFHADYGAFVLVIMSHGTDDEYIYGVDGKLVKLTEIYGMLSADSFPYMAGKPKFIIVQACRGTKEDFGPATRDIPQMVHQLVLNHDVKQSIRGKHQLRVDTDGAGSPKQLNMDDLLILRSCFESFVSIRSPDSGSLMVRCLVYTFRKHASHRDVQTLCEIVQKRVRAKSLDLMQEDPTITGQVPVYIQTFADYRKWYLFPRYTP